MSKMTIVQAKEESAIRQADMRLVGSFITGVEVREEFFFLHRNLIQGPEVLHDPFAKNVWMAVAACHEQTANPEPEIVAAIMIELGLLVGITEAEHDATYLALVDRLRMYAKTGAQTLREWKMVEATAFARVKADKAAQMTQHVQTIMGDNTKTLNDKLLAVQKLAGEALGGEHVFGDTLTVDDQTKLLDGMAESMEKRVGEALVALPPHFGQAAVNIDSLERGEMSVFSAPSGDGKSIFLGMTGEWNFLAQGMNVVSVAFEDDKDTMLKRAAARWVPETAYVELMKGDRRGKLKAYSQFIRDMQEQNGGHLRYEIRPGIGGSELILFLEGLLQDAIAKGAPIDLITVDYLQKIFFVKDVGVYGNETLAVQYIADRLRTLAQTYHCHIMLGSQVTYKDGVYQIAWGKAVGEKAQVHIQGTRELSPSDIYVHRIIQKMGKSEKVDPKLYLKTGEKLPFMFLKSAKLNRHKAVLDYLFVIGASQKIISPAFHKSLGADPSLEWKKVTYQLATDAELAAMDRSLERHYMAIEQADAIMAEIEQAKAAQKAPKGGRRRQEDGLGGMGGL